MKEAAIQKAICYAIKTRYPRAWIDQNPLSELQFGGTVGYRTKLIADLKARGWEPGRPDLIITIPQEGKGLQGCGLEVKRPEENPFRPWKGGGLWIEKTRDSKTKFHILRQMEYLTRLERKGFTFTAFITSVHGALAAIENIPDVFQTFNGVYYELSPENSFDRVRRCLPAVDNRF